MNIGQSLTDLDHPLDYPFFWQGSVAILKNFFQTASRHKLHSEVVVATILKGKSQGSDAWMFQAAQKSNLLVKAFNGSFAIFLAGIGVNEKLFDRIVIGRHSAKLFYFVDSAHATFTKDLHNFEFSIQNGTYREGHT